MPKWEDYKNEAKGRGALAMGVAQAFAILPGISRSGSTITAGLMAGVKPGKAAEFSFLMFLPAIGGGTLLKAKNLMDVAGGSNAAAYGAGFVASFLSGGVVAVSLACAVAAWPPVWSRAAVVTAL